MGDYRDRTIGLQNPIPFLIGNGPHSAHPLLSRAMTGSSGGEGKDSNLRCCLRRIATAGRLVPWTTPTTSPWEMKKSEKLDLVKKDVRLQLSTLPSILDLRRDGGPLPELMDARRKDAKGK